MAVYTKVEENEVSEWLKNYDLGDFHSLKEIPQGTENSNYVLRTDKGRSILTLYEGRTERSRLRFVFNLMIHLKKKGIPCPVPIKNRDGESLSELAGKPAAIISFLEGQWASNPKPTHCRQAGKTLAKMHKAGMELEFPENSFGIEQWNEIFDQCKGKFDGIEEGLEEMVRREMEFLRANWTNDLPKGAIHGDFFPDNALFDKGKLSGSIDFYFAGNDSLAYDLAICINSWCFGEKGFDKRLCESFLKGYESVRPLDRRERDSLPVLGRGAAIRFFLTRAQDWIKSSKGGKGVLRSPLECKAQLAHWQGKESYG